MSRTPSLVLRSLLARPSRTLLTTFGIALGVAVILAISITNLSTIEAVTALFNEASGKANLVVTSSNAGKQGFPADILRRITTVANVKAAIPSLRAETLLADEVSPDQVGMSFFGAVASRLVLYGIDPTLDTQVREYQVVAGQFLPGDLDTYNIVLVKDYANENEIQLGDDVELVTPGGVDTFRVVGLISREGAGQINNGAFGVVPLGVAQTTFDRAGELDQIDILATAQAASGVGLDDLKAVLQARLGDEYAVIYPAAQGKRVTQMLDVYRIGLSFFSVIALFVGTFLIYNAFSMTVIERTREIGVLRAVGMTRRQVMRQILTEAGILGVVGAILGVVGGFLLSYGFIRVMEYVLAQEVRDIRVPLDGLVTSVSVGMFATLVAAAIPVWQAGHVSPLEAVRIRGSSREGWVMRHGWILGAALVLVSFILLYDNPLPAAIREQLANSAVFTLFVGATLLIPVTVGAWERLARPLVRRVYGNEGQLGSSNIQRAKLRTTLTVAALMVGVAMLLSIQAMTDAFKHDIQAWIDVYIGGDLYIHSSLPMRTEFGARLEAVEGAAAVTPIRYLDVAVLKPGGGEEDVAFMAVDPPSYRRVTSFVFAANQGDPDQLMDRLAAGDVVFVSSVLAGKYELQQGDMLRLKTRRGQRDFEVGAVVVDFYNQGLVIEGSYRDMQRYFQVGDTSVFLMKLQPGHATQAVEDRIDRLYGKSRHLTIESNEAIKARVLRLTVQSFSLFDVVAVIGIVVASLGVVNTLTMNVLERTQEIGMLRGVGMTRRQISKMILAEAAMMGGIGGIFGLGFGLFLSRLFLTSAATMQGYNLTYVVPTQGIVIGLLISLLVSQLAAVWPARRAASVGIIEAIQYE